MRADVHALLEAPIPDPDTRPRPQDGDQPTAQGPVGEDAVEAARTTPERVIARARTQRGYREGPRRDQTRFGAWYGWNEVPWCAIFVSWVFWHEGLPLPATTAKGFASCAAGRDWFRRQGRWRPPTAAAQPGWLAFFDWSADPGLDHVGIVIRRLSDGRILTIEGNTSDPGSGSSASVGVFEKHRRAGIVGYGVPNFAAAQVSDELPLLRRGSRGAAVRRVQGLLRAASPAMTDADLSLGGDFGPVTERLVKELQNRHGLEVDGVVGPRTWRALLGLRQRRNESAH
jgi:peptidoglycan hydrolase-like protein with peptidoglycan-binding domain